MKIIIEVPNSTRCLNVCAVYEISGGGMEMAATMRGTDDLHDGAVFKLPNRKEGEKE